MNINITQRQASLTIMTVSAAITCAIVIVSILTSNFSVRTLPLMGAFIVEGVLCLIYARYQWEPTRFIYTLLTPFALAASASSNAFSTYISVSILIPPIIALVMTGPRWVALIGVLTWGLLAQQAGWQGALVKPVGMLSVLLCVIGLAVSRIIMETAQKAAEKSELRSQLQAKELRLSESRYRALAANLPDMAIVLFDEKLRFVLVDGPEIERMGYSKQKMEGKFVYDALSQEAAARVETHMRTALAGQRYASRFSHQNQFYNYQYLPLQDDQGQVAYGMIMAQNITAQKQVEDALRISEERYRAISEMMSDYAYSYSVDEAGNIALEWITAGSFAQITGYAYEVSNQYHSYFLYQDKDQERVRADIEQVVKGKQVMGEYEIITKGGDKRWLSIQRFPVWDEAKQRVTQFYGVAQDITERKQAAEALRINNEQLQVIVSNLPLVFFVIDTNGIFTVSEGKGLGSIGLKPGEAVGQSLFDLYANEPEVVESVQRALKGEITYSLNRLGTLIFEVFFNPMYDTDNNIVGVIGIGVDTTERKVAEDALVKERKLMRTLIDHLPDNIYIKDREGRFVLNNAESMRILGVSRQEDLLGKSDFDFMPSERAELWRREQQGIMERDQPIRDREMFQPWNEVERRWVVGSMIPMHDDTGEVTGLIGINRDITQRKLSEKALLESEERYRIVSELISDYAYSYVVHPDGSIESSWVTEESYENLTGYNTPSERGKSVYSLYHPDEQERVTKDVQATIRGEPTSGEYRIITKSGELRWIYLRRRPLWDEDRTRVIGLYGAAQNITARKHAEEQLQQLNAELEQRVVQRTLQLQEANRELEAFTYSVSHDLRAPLRAISGFSRTVAQNYSEHLPEKAQYYLDRIESNAWRMNTLINDLLALSRLGRKEIRSEKVDMNRLVQRVLNDLLASGQIGSAQFTLGNLPPSYADASLLQQVLINLISNAIKYSAKMKRPRIEIASITKDNEVIYYTKDNGAGFDTQYSDKLFGVFQRLHTEAEFEGTGIGLATVKRIIVRHKGRVWAEGKVGQGATFYFVIGKPELPDEL